MVLSLHRHYTWLVDRLRRRISFRRLATFFLILYACLVLSAVMYIKSSRSEAQIIYAPIDIYNVDARNTAKSAESEKPTKAQERKCFHNMDAIKRPEFHKVANDIYILNGFYDARNASAHRIQILAMAHVTQMAAFPVYCSLYNDDTSSLDVSVVDWHPLHVQAPALYQAYMLSCDIADHVTHNPCKVYLSVNATFGTKEQLTVPLISLVPEQGHQGHYSQGIGVCLPPLHGVIPQSRLVEMVEFNKLLGADRIFLYHYTGDVYTGHNSTNPNTQQVIDWYGAMDRAVTTYQWKLPVPVEMTWNHAHKLAIQHCLYTNMWTHKYLLFMDPDEILIPQDGRTLPKMLQDLDPTSLPSVNATAAYDDAHAPQYIGFCFASIIFPPQFTESLVSIASTDRLKTINFEASKCLVRPQYVRDMGLHTVYRTTPEDLKTKLIDPSIAIIHHYRHCKLSDQEDCSDYIEDSSAVQYKSSLLASYKHVQTELSRAHIPESEQVLFA